MKKILKYLSVAIICVCLSFTLAGCMFNNQTTTKLTKENAWETLKLASTKFLLNIDGVRDNLILNQKTYDYVGNMTVSETGFYTTELGEKFGYQKLVLENQTQWFSFYTEKDSINSCVNAQIVKSNTSSNYLCNNKNTINYNFESSCGLLSMNFLVDNYDENHEELSINDLVSYEITSDENYKITFAHFWEGSSLFESTTNCVSIIEYIITTDYKFASYKVNCGPIENWSSTDSQVSLSTSMDFVYGNINVSEVSDLILVIKQS